MAKATACEKMPWDTPGYQPVVVTSFERRDERFSWGDSVEGFFVRDPTYADAILDRLVHNAHRIELSGDSLRRRKRAA